MFFIDIKILLEIFIVLIVIILCVWDLNNFHDNLIKMVIDGDLEV